MARGRWAALGCFILCAVAYAATAARGSGISLDVMASDFGSWHLARTGRPWLDHADLPSRIALNSHPETWLLTVHGHLVIGRSPGTIAVSLPAYWVFGHARFSVTPSAVTAAGLTAAAVTLLLLALRRSTSLPLTLAACAVFAFATPIWSVAADGVYPHTLTVLGICGMAWAASTGRWWLVGVFGGVALWGRVIAALIVAVVGLHLGARQRNARITLKIAAGSTAALALLSVWTHWMYGTWKPTGSYESSVLQSHAAQSVVSVSNQLGIWVSPGRGILVWTPVVLVMLPGLVRSWSTLPDWSRTLFWAGLLYTVVHAMVNPFGGGTGFYGYRYGLEFIACATPALGCSAVHVGRIGRVVIGPVIGVQLVEIALGAISERHGSGFPDLWRTNFFLTELHRIGAPGWGLVAISATLGLLAVQGARHLAASRTERAPGPADASAAPVMLPRVPHSGHAAP